MTDSPAGFVGLGQIGRPMARRLAGRAAGLWVHDVDEAAVAELRAAGAKAASSPRELAEHASFVSVMVRDDAQVREVLAGEDGILSGAGRGCTVAVHSTIRAETAVELAALAEPHGVAVLDAPVSGGAMGAHDGRLAIMVGGPEEAFEAALPWLREMGELVVRLGPVGAGTHAKLARNLLHFVAFTAVTEAQRLAEAVGVDLVDLGRIVRHTDQVTGGPGAIMHRRTTAPLPEDDDWYPVLDHVRALGEKDLALALDLAERIGVDTPLARLAFQRLGPGLGLGPGPGPGPATERDTAAEEDLS